MPVSPEQTLITVAGALILLLLSVTGFLVTRAMNAIAADIKHAVSTISVHNTEIALLKAEISNLRERLSALEQWRADMAAFLASLGFRRRGEETG